jgi:ArsR family transcriptional regulator, arsenate/arsenite/antimonite-responsive transcriptional repressor / arsenate reductase (thioredoxin)
MDSRRQIAALSALAHPGRLAVFRLLVRRAPDALRPGEIAGILGFRASTLSVHLATLARAGLLRSERDGKSILYSLDSARVADLVGYLVDDCCRGRADLCLPAGRPHPLLHPTSGSPHMSTEPFNILFICTGNSARSILAEAIVNADPSGRFRAFSAGTKPATAPNPHALELLRNLGHDTTALRSKDISAFTGLDAPRFDFVFTVCDHAAAEECPTWPGHPVSAHWGMPDPAKAEGTPAQKALAFKEAYRTLRHRLGAFMALPFDALDRLSLQNRLDAIGRETVKADEPA